LTTCTCSLLHNFGPATSVKKGKDGASWSPVNKKVQKEEMLLIDIEVSTPSVKPHSAHDFVSVLAKSV